MLDWLWRMRKVLALPLVFLCEIFVIGFMGGYRCPVLLMIGVPLVITLAYAVWCDNNALAFIGGLVYPWAFPTLALLYNHLRGGAVLYIPPEGFLFFGGIGVAFSLMGFFAAKGAMSRLVNLIKNVILALFRFTNR